MTISFTESPKLVTSVDSRVSLSSGADLTDPPAYDLGNTHNQVKNKKKNREKLKHNLVSYMH